MLSFLKAKYIIKKRKQIRSLGLLLGVLFHLDILAMVAEGLAEGHE